MFLARPLFSWRQPSVPAPVTPMSHLVPRGSSKLLLELLVLKYRRPFPSLPRHRFCCFRPAAGRHARGGTKDATWSVQPSLRRQPARPADGFVPQQPHSNTAGNSGEVGRAINRLIGWLIVWLNVWSWVGWGQQSRKKYAFLRWRATPLLFETFHGSSSFVRRVTYAKRRRKGRWHALGLWSLCEIGVVTGWSPLRG